MREAIAKLNEAAKLVHEAYQILRTHGLVAMADELQKLNSIIELIRDTLPALDQ